MHRALVAAIALAALPLAAAEQDRPLSGAEFDALATGRTMYYNSGGAAYGVEQYLPGRRVVWAFVGDDCRDGTWYEDGPFICFVYEDDPAPQCWTFYQTDRGLLAKFRDDPAGLPLIAVQQSPEPMACMGPDIGV